MLKSERKQVILEQLKHHRTVSLETLVQILKTSESTVRRDLDELENEKKLRRVHGGAESIRFLQEEESNQEKYIKNIHDKQRIAEKAASLIQDNDVVFIDAGTTNDFLIHAIEHSQVTIVTNSIHHASKLVERNIPTVIIGGVALNQIGQLNFDKAFLGMNAIDSDFFTTPDMEEGAVKRAILENAKNTYVLADSSKLGETSFVKVAPVSKASIITNRYKSEVVEVLKGKTEVIEV